MKCECMGVLLVSNKSISSKRILIIVEFHNYTEMLTELLRREKEAMIEPDSDIDAYMKVIIKV